MSSTEEVEKAFLVNDKGAFGVPGSMTESRVTMDEGRI